MMGRRKHLARHAGRPDPKQRCNNGAEDPRQARRARLEEGRSPGLPEEGREGSRGPRGGAPALANATPAAASGRYGKGKGKGPQKPKKNFGLKGHDGNEK